MAFHQPTRQPLQRIVRAVADDQDASRLSTPLRDQAAPDESQTWVVFSPATDITTSTSYLSDAEEARSIPTPGRSRVSDLGSLHTAARSRSQQDTDSRHSAALSSSAVDDESLEDDAELDSLDSHLPDFRTFASAYNQPSPAGQPQHTAPVLPAHDGLGSFRLDGPVGPEVQDHLYAFERFNPRRTRKRRESQEEAELEAQHHEEQHAHKMQRIEAWRMEQSRILLEEIHKETRRRRQSQTSNRPNSLAEGRTGSADREGINAAAAASADHESMDWHEDPLAYDDQDQGVFAKVARKVIRDLMGIDERLLSILLGEALPEDDELSSTPKAIDPAVTPSGGVPITEDESSWQLRVIERAARELGLFVNQISPHPGAFSSYTRMQQMPLPYAGLPVIPEAAIDASTSTTSQAANNTSVNLPEFKPTMPPQSQPISIPGVHSQPETSKHGRTILESTVQAPTTFTQEEWEKDLDIKLVFRYLRNRFTSSRPAPSTPSFTSGTSHLATCSTQDTAAKAARVRQHHPLVSGTARGSTRPPAERRTFKATATSPSPAGPVAAAVAARHAASSCASHSTRRSARRSSVSSRHYWDIGGSLGTGSVIASAGPMGSWGEV